MGEGLYDVALEVFNDQTVMDDAAALIEVTESIPSEAVLVNPSNEAIYQPVSLILSWQNGSGATNYDVLLGTTSSLNDDDFKGNRAETTFDPGVLEKGTTYYWRIDAVNDAGTTTGAL